MRWNEPVSRIAVCIAVSTTPGRMEMVTTEGSSLPSVRPREFMAAFEALGRLSRSASSRRLEGSDSPVRSPPTHTTSRRTTTHENDSPVNPCLASLLCGTQVGEGMSQDGNEGEEVDLEQRLVLVELAHHRGRLTEGGECPSVDCRARQQEESVRMTATHE